MENKIEVNLYIRPETDLHLHLHPSDELGIFEISEVRSVKTEDGITIVELSPYSPLGEAYRFPVKESEADVKRLLHDAQEMEHRICSESRIYTNLIGNATEWFRKNFENFDSQMIKDFKDNVLDKSENKTYSYESDKRI